jgi:hypothetical protein
MRDLDCEPVAPFVDPSFRCERTSAFDPPFACLDAGPFGLFVGFEAASKDFGNVTTSEYSAFRLYDVTSAARAASELASPKSCPNSVRAAAEFASTAPAMFDWRLP